MSSIIQFVARIDTNINLNDDNQDITMSHTASVDDNIEHKIDIICHGELTKEHIAMGWKLWKFKTKWIFPWLVSKASIWALGWQTPNLLLKAILSLNLRQNCTFASDPIFSYLNEDLQIKLRRHVLKKLKVAQQGREVFAFIKHT